MRQSSPGFLVCATKRTVVPFTAVTSGVAQGSCKSSDSKKSDRPLVIGVKGSLEGFESDENAHVTGCCSLLCFIQANY